MTAARPNGNDAGRDPDVLIIGAGFAGLGAAIRLKQRGYRDFLILERSGEIGGTWRDNSYPGIACDVPSHLYSFSFAPNPSWSRSFSPGREIQRYLLDCVQRYGLRPYLRLDHGALAARWDERAGRWRVETARGTFSGRVLVAGTGALSEPSLPDIPGLESFRGTSFHSSRWNHDHALAGRRIAVIGTGASAIQFVPEIQPGAERLYVFQRTPAWVTPRPDRAFRRFEHRLFRALPVTQRLARAGIYWGRELLAVGMTMRPKLLDRTLGQVARRQLHSQISDPALRSALTPDFTIGCKRILLSNAWYPALTSSNVELVTESIKEIRPDSILTADGAERAVDTIIFGTGFRPTRPPVAERVFGRAGVSLADTWRDGMQAYRGTTIAGFPNLFMLVGPNTGQGHSSMIHIIESQLNYLLSALSKMEKQGIAVVEVEHGAQAGYNDWLQRRMGRTVWLTGGCASWYLDGNGRNTTLWPSFTWRFRQLTRSFDPRGYRLERAAGRPAVRP